MYRTILAPIDDSPAARHGFDEALALARLLGSRLRVLHVVCDTTVQEARDSGAELIVMGTHGRRGLRRVALGSDAELVVRDSPIPVLLVRGLETDDDA